MRTFDARFLNEVANHPEVRPTLFGEGEIDLTETLLNPNNYALINEMGGFVLSPNAPGVYEVHSIFLPGSNPIEFMGKAQEWMFTRTSCLSITSKVPVSNRGAKGLALSGGLSVWFERDESQFGKCQFVELTINKWALNTKSLEDHGERFHDLIEAAKIANGSDRPIHSYDPAHERAVGASVLMIERGQPIKGVDFYNRWANLAGYSPITLISLVPVTVDVVDAIIGLNDIMEVQLCR